MTEPTAEGLAAAFSELLASEETARRYGEAGEPAAARDHLGHGDRSACSPSPTRGYDRRWSQ